LKTKSTYFCCLCKWTIVSNNVHHTILCVFHCNL